MDDTTVETLVELLEAVLKIAPAIPEVVLGVETAITLARSNIAPTTEQQVQIDAALDTAHAAFQAA